MRMSVIFNLAIWSHVGTTFVSRVAMMIIIIVKQVIKFRAIIIQEDIAAAAGFMAGNVNVAHSPWWLRRREYETSASLGCLIKSNFQRIVN